MSRGNHYAAQADPVRSPNFIRRWSEKPSRAEGLVPVGEVANSVANDIALHAVRHWLAQADRVDGEDRRACLEAAEVIADLKFRRQVEHLHGLGARVVGELLAEIGAERSIQTLIDRKIDTYATLKPEALEATGGGGFWPAPLRKV